MKNKITIKIISSVMLLCWNLISCNGGIPTPCDTKHLSEFHETNFGIQEKNLEKGKLDLYVDYSTCIALGQNSSFFQEFSKSLVARTSAFYSIKGKSIKKENGSVYQLLRNINEVNFAEIAKVVDGMAKGNCESVLLSDLEYYTPSIAKGHENDPYLYNAFKTWVLRGYDIHIISEPYQEPWGKKSLEKKRFYVLFTDDRMEDNIYERIKKTVNWETYPDVEEFHLSASYHPKLKLNKGKTSIQHPLLPNKSNRYGTYEIQEWDGCDWKSIENFIIKAMDTMGNQLKNGEPIIQLEIDKNAFGFYDIESLKLEVYDINDAYSAFYNRIKSGNSVCTKIENFMLIDDELFKEKGLANIHFNRDWFDPNILTGTPFNYFKIDISVEEVKSTFNNASDAFTFDAFNLNGAKNYSVTSSIQQYLADNEVEKRIKEQVIYTIYIKSEKR